MDFSREFSMFQLGNHDTNEKLDYYQKFITSLLGELKTLQETMCTYCKQKCASSKAIDSMRPQKLTLPQRPKIKRTPAPSLSSLPINETLALDTSLVLTERRNEYGNPTFYAKRETLPADLTKDSTKDSTSTIDVTFVHFFRHKNNFCCVSFSPDGRYMAVGTGNDGDNGSIIIYDVESREKYCKLKEYPSRYGSYTGPRLWDLCFSSDGRYLAVLDGAKRNIIWDIRHKRIRSIFHGGTRLREVSFSPDGRLIAIRTDAGLLVLNVRDNSTKMVYKGGCFDFSPNGRYIATGNGEVLVILDLRTGKVVKRWNGRGMCLSCVKFTLDGNELLCAYETCIEQWDVSAAEPVLIRRIGCNTYFYRSSISPDHRLLAYSNQLWNVNTGKREYTLQEHILTVTPINFSTAGTYLAIGSYDGGVSLWRYAWT